MSAHELDRAVAKATGESCATIRRRGFSLADPDVVSYDPEPDFGPNTIDWDAEPPQRAALSSLMR